MTDRHAGYIITLERDIREDDAQAITNAIGQIRGVIDVQPIIADSNLMMAEARAVAEWRSKIIGVLWPKRHPDAD